MVVCAWHPDGSSLISCDRNKRAIIWTNRYWSHFQTGWLCYHFSIDSQCTPFVLSTNSAVNNWTKWKIYVQQDTEASKTYFILFWKRTPWKNCLVSERNLLQDGIFRCCKISFLPLTIEGTRVFEESKLIDKSEGFL